MTRRKAKPMYDTPCSKCGVHVKFGDARNRLGNLADHRLCPVPEAEEDS
ncbi:hypothetical protein DEU34_2252 [Microbacterium sp. AG1240]|nr:hypothetical protein DEU34_2252 [Microbacterium sp. AG1240]